MLMVPRSFLILFLLVLALISVDFFSKEFVSKSGFAGLVIHENSGVSLGLGSTLVSLESIQEWRMLNSFFWINLCGISTFLLLKVSKVGERDIKKSHESQDSKEAKEAEEPKEVKVFNSGGIPEQDVLALALLIGGMWANTLDRVVTGVVRDWIPVPGLGLYNNLADWAIALGCILWIYQYFFKTKT